MTLILKNNKESHFTHKENTERIKMSLKEEKEGNVIQRNLAGQYKSVSTTVTLQTSLESCLSRTERQCTDQCVYLQNWKTHSRR